MSRDRAGYKFARSRNSGFRRNGQTAAALRAADTGEMSCDMQTGCVAVASAHAVSPAISLPVSPASSREQSKTETQGSQCSNKSGSEPNAPKPNCYACIHRRSLLGDAHSQCVNPRINDSDRLLTPLLLMHGMVSPAMKRLNVVGSAHGIRSGWFFWPMNFDPVWLVSCDGYEAELAKDGAP